MTQRGEQPTAWEAIASAAGHGPFETLEQAAHDIDSSVSNLQMAHDSTDLPTVIMYLRTGAAQLGAAVKRIERVIACVQKAAGGRGPG